MIDASAAAREAEVHQQIVEATKKLREVLDAAAAEFSKWPKWKRDQAIDETSTELPRSAPRAVRTRFYCPRCCSLLREEITPYPPDEE